MRLEQLARAAEQRITAQRDLAQKARALAAEERDQWRGPASGAAGADAKRARELAALAEAAEKATAALPDVQAWRTDADVVERDGEFFVEDTLGNSTRTATASSRPRSSPRASPSSRTRRARPPPSRVKFFNAARRGVSERDATRRIADDGADAVKRTEAAAAQLEKRPEEAAALSERRAAAEDANGEAPREASAPAVETRRAPSLLPHHARTNWEDCSHDDKTYLFDNMF